MTRFDYTSMYELYYKKLYHISYCITRDAYLAEDAVQETFLKVMKKSDSLIDAGKLGAWLSVVATRTAIDLVRKERKQKAHVQESETIETFAEAAESVEDKVGALLLSETMQQSITKLSDNYRKILLLKITKGYRDQEIAEALNLHPGTVKTRIYRARKQLKRIVEVEMSAS